MAEIWLMRHGAYEGHVPGHHAPRHVPLSETGRAQAAMATPLPPDISAIVTSPLPRAEQTAEIVSRLTGLPVIATSDLLSEWRAPSAVIGQTATGYPPAYVDWRRQRTQDPAVAFEDGESLAQLHDRACRAAGHVAAMARSSGAGLLVVSHKLLLGVLTALHDGPRAFERAAQAEWDFAEIRPFRDIEVQLRPDSTRSAPTYERT